MSLWKKLGALLGFSNGEGRAEPQMGGRLEQDSDSADLTWRELGALQHGATKLEDGVEFPEELYELRRKSLARAGERLACCYLEQRCGMKLRVANAKVYLTPERHRVAGELDLIMDDGDLLVFVEVRSREGSYIDYSTPASTVNLRKRQHICHAARLWLKQNEVPLTQRIRFDVVAVNWVINRVPKIEYLPNAFTWSTPSWRKRVK